LHEVRDTASRGVTAVERQIQDAEDSLLECGQDIRDAAGGVVDTLADTVESGSDAVSNAMDSATDFAAASLDRLTNLLG
jgi:hypothetical protein